MVELLRNYLDRLLNGKLEYQDSLVLSNLLRIYHRSVAKQKSLPVSQGGWFMKLVDKFNDVEFQRGVVDIVKQHLEVHNKYYVADIPQIYIDKTMILRDKLTDFLNK